ncbi:MAG: Gfo/Idh/MocA family oxidoreductase [Chloroflexota bacterium]
MATVGVGWAGQRQLRAIEELGRDVIVVGLVDCDEDFLQQQALAFGIHNASVDLHTMLDDPSIDAVSICVPHALHCPVALDVARAGKHILCEKPIALTVAEATQMIEAAQHNQVKLYVAENEVYTPMVRFLRNVVQTGAYIGEIVSASVVHGFRAPHFAYPGRRFWLTEPDQGGTGTWMLHGIHTVAQMRHIFGDVATIYVREHMADSSVGSTEGTMSGLLTFESGLSVSVVQTREAHVDGKLGGFILRGAHGTLHATSSGCMFWPSEMTPHVAPIPLPYPSDTLSSYAQEIAAFADYVAGRSVGPTTGESERRSLAVVQAGYESARTGQPVVLRERFGLL